MLERAGRITTTGMFSVSLLEECRSGLGIELFDQYVGLAAEADPKTIRGIDGERTLVITAMDGAIGPDPLPMPLRIVKILLREEGNRLSFTGNCPHEKRWWTGLKQVDRHVYSHFLSDQ